MQRTSQPSIASAPKSVAVALVALVMTLVLALATTAPSQPAYADETLTAGTTATGTAAATTQNQIVKPKATVKVRAKVKTKGWLKTVKAGKTAGTKTKKGLSAFKVTLSGMKGVSGHVKYKTYDKGLGWGATAKDGKTSGRSSRVVQAVKVWLTGSVSKYFDVKYRVYIKGKGWKSWVRNKAKAGSTKKGDYITAVKVKLVRKSEKKSLDGIDISSWQAGINPKTVDADFVIVKATEGTWYKNPYFDKWAKATLASGKLLGAYHFVRTGNAKSQADYFVKTVGPYVGKCALFLDWENRYDDNSMDQGPAWAKKFMDRIYQKTGVRPLIYMSKNVTREYDWSKVAKRYGLWVAQYLYKYYTNGSRYVTNPDSDENGYGAWKSPTIYQYNSNGWIDGYSSNIDINKFYGTTADWEKMAARA